MAKKKVVHVDAQMSAYLRGDAFRAFVTSVAGNGIRLDAAQGVFFERELMQTLGRTYDYEYPQQKGRLLVPVSNEIDPGAQTMRYVQYNKVGRAKIIRDFSDDLPEVQVMGKEFLLTPKSLGDSYKYSIDELASAVLAARNGVPGPSLDQRRANTAREVVEYGLDDIIAVGDADSGLLGLINAPNSLTYTVAPGANNLTTWASKSPLEIYNDLNGIQTAIVDLTNGVEVPDIIVTPILPYGFLTQPMTVASPVTVLQYFIANSPYAKIVDQWYKLKGAGANATDRMMAYRRDPMKVAMYISREFTQEAPQQKNLAWVINCHAKTFGVVAHYPKSIAVGDGI